MERTSIDCRAGINFKSALRNLKAAKQIGLTIPPNVLARPDRVF